MAEVGVVARTGTLLGDQPIPIDVLLETDRAQRLAHTFKAAVENTAYYQRWMWTSDDIPAEVIDGYAEVACLCQMQEAERQAVHDALFGVDPEPTAANAAGEAAVDGSVATSLDADVRQRIRSVGHFLTLVAEHPEVVENYRSAHSIAVKEGRSEGQANTEALRKAMVYYRSLFDELLVVDDGNGRRN